MVRSVEKTCGMSEKEENDLFYVCSLIEHVGRKTKNRRGDVVAAFGCIKFLKAEEMASF